MAQQGWGSAVELHRVHSATYGESARRASKRVWVRGVRMGCSTSPFLPLDRKHSWTGARTAADSIAAPHSHLREAIQEDGQAPALQLGLVEPLHGSLGGGGVREAHGSEAL